jgi:ADP-L-glycero-D-manno-heptose 6-epimerase
MASPVHKFTEQAIKSRVIKIFSDTPDVKKEFHLRDFIHVDDCVNLNLFLMDSINISGIFNCGTGTSYSFFDIAKDIQVCMAKLNIKVEINEIPMPEKLLNSYQFYTKANLEKLRNIGWSKSFKSIDAGITEFVNYKLSI